MHQLTTNSQCQQQLLLKGLMNQIVKWRAENPHLIVDDVTLQQVLENSLPPGYDYDDSYDLTNDDNIPEANSSLYTVACDDVVNGPLQIHEFPMEQENNGSEMLDFEHFAPENYGEECNGTQMLRERRMQQETLFSER